MNKTEEHFDLDIAIEDEGVCTRQTVTCDCCAMGELLGYARKDQLCPCNEVYEMAKKIKIEHEKNKK